MNTTAPERSAPTQPSGVIEWVTFFNEESGFCVLRIKSPGILSLTSRHLFRNLLLCRKRLAISSV